MRLAWGMIFLAACAQSARQSPPGQTRDLAPFLEAYDAGAEPGDLAGAKPGDLAGVRPDLLAAADLAQPRADLAVAGDLAHAASNDPLIYVHEAATLYTVDPDSFELTTVGSFGLGAEVTDIAVRADDTLIACTRTGLYSVDAANGHATLIVENAFTQMTALTFLSDDRLLGADSPGNVYQLSWHVSGGTTIADVSTLGSYGGGMTTAGDLTSVDDGTMWGLTNGGSGSDANNALLIVNNVNGHGTVKGATGYGMLWGSAFSRGRILGFSSTGQVVGIDPSSGTGTLLKTHAGKSFYGAATNPTALP